jgi:hypothetical protein
MVIVLRLDFLRDLCSVLSFFLIYSSREFVKKENFLDSILYLGQNWPI